MITFKITQAKWPVKLYPALRGEALEVYHQIYSNSYDHIKCTFLLHAGITPKGKLHETMFNPPPPNQTAVNTLGHFQGILQQFLRGQTFDQICSMGVYVQVCGQTHLFLRWISIPCGTSRLCN